MMTRLTTEEPGRVGGSVLMFKTQTRFFPLDPRLEEIHIEDIAHNLARLTRWLGSTREPYSIAQHCCLVGNLVFLRARRLGWSLIFAELAALLHDAPEAYINDFAHPVKHSQGGGFFKQIEDPIQWKINEKFLGVSQVDELLATEIKLADDTAAALEMKWLVSATRELPIWWPQRYHNLKLPDVKIRVWSAAAAEMRFLETFNALREDLNK